MQRGREFGVTCFLLYFPFPHGNMSSALNVFTMEDLSVRQGLATELCLQVLSNWCTYAKCLELSDKHGVECL